MAPSLSPVCFENRLDDALGDDEVFDPGAVEIAETGHAGGVIGKNGLQEYLDRKSVV